MTSETQYVPADDVGLMFGTGLALACAQPAEASQNKLQGTWTAIKAERDGKSADDLVGHQLSFSSNRFQIRSKDAKALYTGTVRVAPAAKPAAIDFKHTRWALKGKAWKGIYALHGDTLTICDNAPNLEKPRPAEFDRGADLGTSSLRSSVRTAEAFASEGEPVTR